MDKTNIGQLIRSLRKERGLSQLQLAQILFVSEKTISKWECGAGLPDIGSIAALCEALGVSPDTLLDGVMPENSICGGNMKKTNFHVCPQCGNVCTSAGEAQISCCGRILSPLRPQKTSESQSLLVEIVEEEWYITSNHPMTKAHYISFVAYLTSDRLTLIKQYPEWNLQCRIPRQGHGVLFWYCCKDGLFSMRV
ncbi:MAG: helix-turn-helix domain-containing protein [Oscillospiraceae bacterium]|jgi:DNA-binding XRE family transcriptional regulator|nr:helix-turn-helix domain-containing protein [Oscillospiraceae bacterium]